MVGGKDKDKASGKPGGKTPGQPLKNDENEQRNEKNEKTSDHAVVKQEEVEIEQNSTEDSPTSSTVSPESSDSEDSDLSSQEESEKRAAENLRREYLLRREVTMSSLGNKIPPIDLDADDLAEQFKLFRYRHENLMTILKIDAGDKAGRAASFRMELPEEAQLILMDYDWTASAKDKDSIEDIISVVCQAKSKKSTKIVARHKFLTRFMRKGERFSDFKKAIVALAELCGYPKELKETLIRDMIISRHNDEPFQKQLLFDLEDDVTLDKVVALCERHEHTGEAAKEMRGGASHQVNANNTKDHREKGKEKKKRDGKGAGAAPPPEKDKLWRCDRFCGGYHIRGHQNCKAYGKTCTKCGKMNHFEEVCINAPQPGWKPRSRASEENHKKRKSERAFAATDESSDGETQRDDTPRSKRRDGYDTDQDPVRSDPESKNEPTSPTLTRPARKVQLVTERLKITAHSEADLRNTLEKKEETRKRYEGVEMISIIRENGERMVIRPRFSSRVCSHRYESRDNAREQHRHGRPKDHRSDERQHGRKTKSPRRETRDNPGPSRSRSPHRGKPEKVEKDTKVNPKPADKEKVGHTPAKTKKPADDELDFELDTDSEEVRALRMLPRTWDENVAVNGLAVKMKIDSGSTINTMSWSTFQRLGLNERIIEPTSTTISTYSQTRMQPMGEFTATIALRGKKTRGKFLLLEEDVPPLLGMPSGAALGLFRMNKSSLAQYITVVDEFEFEGIDAVLDEFLQPCQKEVNIKLKDDATPVVIPARRVPLALQEEVWAELQRMQRLGVISPVNEPRQWCHAMVVARKPNGKLRICIDPRTLNPHLEREEMMIPDIDGVIMNLDQAKVLTVLDLEAGFWQVGVDEKSAKLLTFATPWGRFQYNRLPFGISIAPEIFHKAVVDALQGIPGVVVFIDDILIYAPTKEEHDARLAEVKKRLKEASFTENESKSGQVAKSEVKFLGHIVGNGKIRPDPAKLTALLEMPEPKCRKELKGFEGMLGWLRKFLPELSEYLNAFRHLQKAHTAWTWTKTEVFDRIKDALRRIQPLMAIKPGEPFALAADASAYGLGAALTQTDAEGNDRPIFFASRLMNDHELRYAQVDKELLAVAWALERLDTLVYGQRITVRTDHKPLLGLIKKPMAHMSPRQQRLVSRLMRYDFELLYVPGRELVAADFLSRTASREGPECRCKMFGTDIDVEKAFVSMVDCVDMTEDVMKKCRDAARTDTEYMAACAALKRGWSSSDKKNVAEYWSHRDDLTQEDELLFFEGRLVVPRTARKDVLTFLHQGHVGMNTMGKRATATVWWPALRNDIKMKVDRCMECQMSRPAQRREPMLSFEVPSAPGLTVHSDYFEFGARDYLIVVDGFSGWTELLPVSSKRPKELMRAMRVFMIRNGVPKRFHSDQGSTFEAEEFQNFCRRWGIEFTDNSPKYSRGNAIAEAHVKKAKHLLSTAVDEDDLARGLIALMQTPVAPGRPSPAQLHLGRNVRNALHPEVKRNDHPWEEHKKWKEEKAVAAKKYYDRGTRALRELESGEKVLVWHHDRWQRGTVLEKLGRPRSYAVQIEETGQRLQRNRAMLRALDEAVEDEENKACQPFSMLQQRFPVRVLNPRPSSSGAASTSADPAVDTDNDEASDIDQEEPVMDEEEEDEWSDASLGDVPDPATPPPSPYRTRQGRAVRAPDRYTPS